MGGKSGGGKYRVVDYTMSAHFGICHGPVDALLGIQIKDKDAWPGLTVYETEQDAITDARGSSLGIFGSLFNDFISSLPGLSNNTTNNTAPVVSQEAAIPINRPYLFGGEKKEGGLVGEAYWFPGTATQTMPDRIAARYGRTGTTMTGYRNLASIFFSKGGSSGGFQWSQNNPYLPGVSCTVFVKPVGLAAETAVIQRDDYWPDANPAHIMYEALLDEDWGNGLPETVINKASFEAGATQLFNEQFGLSLAFFEQTTVRDFISEILDHIQGMIYTDPRTGLITLKLIRDDYDISAAPHFDPDNCRATNRQRKSLSETVNEIVVSWTDPANEKGKTLTVQDIANIAMQGAVVSDTRDYYGVRNVELATTIAARDLRSASAPLYSASLEIDRRAWDVVPGDVCTFSWPEDDLVNIVMRVQSVDYGRPGDPYVKVQVLEDIFSLGTAEWEIPDSTLWEDSSEDPMPMEHVQIATVPYPVLSALGVAPEEDDFPVVGAGVFAAQSGADTYNFDLIGERVLPNGSTETATLGTKYQTLYGTLPVALAWEAVTSYNNLGTLLGAADDPAPGMFLYLGDEQGAHEIIMLDSVTSGGQWTLARGMFDTIPHEWPAGTPFWVIDTGNITLDENERAAGETVEYQLLPRTSKGLLPLDQAAVVAYTLSDRPYLPFRPANVTIDGLTHGEKTFATQPTTIPITWKIRNRTVEDSIARRWGEDSVVPEVGQTTKIVLTDHAGNFLYAYESLTGESFDLDVADMISNTQLGNVIICVHSTRDGFDSLQASSLKVFIPISGYGGDYGKNYGGSV